MIRLLSGDCRDVLATLPAESVQCVVTSPPYYGLRDYGTALWDGGDAACQHIQMAVGMSDKNTLGTDGYLPPTNAANVGRVRQFRDTCGKCGAVRVDRQIGLEATPEEYLATMVGVFRKIRRVLRRDGTCWVNMGDSYASNPSTARSGGFDSYRGSDTPTLNTEHQGRNAYRGNGVKAKDLLLMPARLALALQADGWWVRSDIIWHKPNPMPESVTDRPTSAHEHVFLLTRSARYFYDAEGVREEAEYGYREHTGEMRSVAQDGRRHTTGTTKGGDPSTGRNLRNVWTIATHAYPDAHFATFPPELAERCIKAGSRPGDTVLDPFAGAGTTLLVADRLQRDAIGIELNTAYTEMAMERCRQDAPLFTSFPPDEPPEDERMADLFTDMAAD